MLHTMIRKLEVSRALQQALETGTNECKCEIGPHIINLPIAKCEVDNNVGWRWWLTLLLLYVRMNSVAKKASPSLQRS